jgi:hypothetical protein
VCRRVCCQTKTRGAALTPQSPAPDQDWAILSSTAFSLAALPREPRPPPPRWPAARKMALRGRQPAASLYLLKTLNIFARSIGRYDFTTVVTCFLAILTGLVRCSCGVH